MKQETLCALCDQKILAHSIASEKRQFCCVGCHAVYQILSTRNELDRFQDNPLFKQAVKSGLISNPYLIAQLKKDQSETIDQEVERLHLEIKDLWCPYCAEIISLFLLQEKGITKCTVDYSTDLASIEYCPRYVSKEDIFSKIKKIGYTPALLQDVEKHTVSPALWLRFIVACFFSLNIMMFSYPIYASYFDQDDAGAGQIFVWISFFSSLPILFYSGWPILKRFWNSALTGFVGMEFLIVLGVSSAFGLSIWNMSNGGNHVYFDSMSVIITFVLLGKIIESKAKFSAKNSLFRLTRAIPKRGRKVFSDGKEEFVLVKEVNKGDFLVALSGEKVVLDGIVTEGEGSCDESLMTGEAIPVRKSFGEHVLSGTILCQGRIVYRVATSPQETTLHHIIDAIEKDIGTKTVYTRAVDPIIRWFIPAVVLIALISAFGAYLIGYSVQEALIRGVSVLLISCPCAIGIAAPLAESQTLSGLASIGVIVRNRGCLASIGREDQIIFDKTGTITEGLYRVLTGLESLSETDLGVLRSMALQSNHPICTAIARSIKDPPLEITRLEEFIGRGIRGSYCGEWYTLGSAVFLRQMEIATTSTNSCIKELNSESYFARGDRVLTCIYLGDTIRPESKEVLSALAPTPTILLSGDSAECVGKIAELCGFTSWKSGCSPLEKRDYVDGLRKKGEVVCMVGDGINDALALTGANIGISVASATDISVQVSDIMLATDNLSVLPKLRLLAIKGRKVVYENLFWAFFYNLIGIGLASTGYLSPIYASGAMVTSSLFILLNTHRINTRK